MDVVGTKGTLVPELTDDDRTDFARLVRADPIVNAVVDSRLSALVPLVARRPGGGPAGGGGRR